MDSIVFPDLPTYVFELSPAGVLSTLLTFVLPLLAALLMRSKWSAYRKGLVLLALSAVKAYAEAVIGAQTSGEPFHAGAAGYATFMNFLVAVVFYVGLLKRTAIQQAALTGGLVRDKAVDGRARYTD